MSTTMKKAVRLSKEEYYKKHLYLINYILPTQMTRKEVEFLAHFMCLEGELKDTPFCTTGRNIVKEKMGVSSGGIGNYLVQLKKKNFITEKDGKLQILPVLIPNENSQTYMFKLIKEEKKDV